MTGKLKVSREVADAIEAARKRMSDEALLTYHAEGIVTSGDFWVAKEIAALNQLSPYQLATALIVGYEVAMTPHERIAYEYNYYQKRAKDEKNGREKWVGKGYVRGVQRTLKDLNITVKGVNDNDNNS